MSHFYSGLAVQKLKCLAQKCASALTQLKRAASTETDSTDPKGQASESLDTGSGLLRAINLELMSSRPAAEAGKSRQLVTQPCWRAHRRLYQQSALKASHAAHTLQLIWWWGCCALLPLSPRTGPGARVCPRLHLLQGRNLPAGPEQPWHLLGASHSKAV